MIKKLEGLVLSVGEKVVGWDGKEGRGEGEEKRREGDRRVNE
jgi:hypothetical protein